MCQLTAFEGMVGKVNRKIQCQRDSEGGGRKEETRERKILEEDFMFEEKYKGIFLFSALWDGLHNTFTEI